MIFYFSATGNSKWAAQFLAEHTHDRIFDIAKANLEPSFEISLKEGERLAFIFPVHGWRVPIIVREFIDALIIHNYKPTTYTYALCTCGDSIGETIKLLTDLLSGKSIHLNASFSLIMPESYIGLPFMYLDDIKNKQRKYANATARLNRFSEWISESRGGEYLDKGTFPKLYSGLLGGFFYSNLITDSHFHVDKTKCIGCSQCSQICPVSDISKEPNSFPEWKHNGKCLTCFACLHHCPVNAISWGWFTKGKGQYFYGKQD